MIVKGKILVISGIGPGLGTKLAVHAALEGAAGVAIGGRKPEKIAHVERAVKAAGADCPLISIQCDIRYAEQCQALADAAIAEFGRIDALINNAFFHGASLHDNAASTDFAEWEEQYATNVIGTMRMSHAVIPQMRAQGEGAIVMVNTMGAKMVPIVGETGYCASKAALFNATRALAADVGKDNIRVNSLHPGFMWGDPVRAAMSTFAKDWGGEQAALDKITAHNLLPRIVTDDEVARAGLFLASDYASGLTGATLDANGGAFLP